RLVVVVSHDLESAEKFADYIIRIKDGEVNEKTGLTTEVCEKNSSFQVEKNHGLKITDVIKSAMTNMKFIWVRTLLNFIICFLGLTIFFVANVIATVDAPSRLVNGLYENHISSGEIRKKSDSLTHYGFFSSIDEANEICDANPELEFFKINLDSIGDFGIGCHGIAEISHKTVERQKLIYGEMTSDLNDYFITRSLAESLLEELQSKWSWDPSIAWWKPPIVLTENIECLIGYEVTLHDKVFTLRGIVEDSNLPNYYVYFNDGFFNSIPDVYEKGYCYYMYFIMSGNFKADYKFFREYHGDMTYHQTNSKYVIRTAISDDFYRTMATYISMTDWLYGISVVQMLFVILICFNIISLLIRKNQKENGILRALGYSNFDIFKIYLLQMSIPFIFLIPLVSTSGYFIVTAINEHLLKKLSVSFGMFSIGVMNIVWLLLLCVGIVVISTILPMIKLFKAQPINIIKAD
ncbi:MAG: FtsX-like permease family protein, partial [Anaeroplasmataceae bacterium]|nr:FtsX-like permease family protein [Anaeroplasmataceae bacterium]